MKYTYRVLLIVIEEGEVEPPVPPDSAVQFVDTVELCHGQTESLITQSRVPTHKLLKPLPFLAAVHGYRQPHLPVLLRLVILGVWVDVRVRLHEAIGVRISELILCVHLGLRACL